MAAIPSNPSPQLRLVLDAMEAASSSNWDRAASMFSPDFGHQLLPPSLNQPRRNFEEFKTSAERFFVFLEDLKVSLFHTLRIVLKSYS
jgi:hypothetical protein